MRNTLRRERGAEAYWVPIQAVDLIELSDTMRGAIRLAPVDQLQAYVTTTFDVESCVPIGIFEFLLDRSAGRICMAFSYSTAGSIDGQLVVKLCSTKPLWIPVTDVDKAAEALHDICRDNHWRATN